MRLFGKAKKAPPPSDSINKLRDTQRMLEKREAFLEKKAEAERAKAKENASKNRRVALMALRRKRMYDSQIEKLGAARMTIETQVMAIESATANFAALDAMRTGSSALRQLSRGMDVTDVEDTLEDIREQMEVANEIGDAIAQPLDGLGIDDDDLEKELDELEQQRLDEELLGAGTVPQNHVAAPVDDMQLPDVPDTQPSLDKDAEAELRALEQEMAFT